MESPFASEVIQNNFPVTLLNTRKQSSLYLCGTNLIRGYGPTQRHPSTGCEGPWVLPTGSHHENILLRGTAKITSVQLSLLEAKPDTRARANLSALGTIAHTKIISGVSIEPAGTCKCERV